MQTDWAALRAGLLEGWRATRPYLLSHHRPSEYDRCYALAVGDRTVRLCARCSGIYPGIALGLLLGVRSPAWLPTLAVVALGPLPALLDWARTAGADAPSGSNPVRTATGALLGIAYGLGLVALLAGHDWRVLAVGLGYGALAAVLLSRAGGAGGPDFF